MHVYLHKTAAAKFRRKANKVAPREEFGILLGEIEGESVLIHDVYFPLDRLDESTEQDTAVCLDWFQDAEEWAARKGQTWIALGDIHSHCYNHAMQDIPTHEPSEQDWNSARVIHDSVLPTYCVFGICRVVMRKKKRRATIKLWPLPQELSTTIIEGVEEEEE